MKEEVVSCSCGLERAEAQTKPALFSSKKSWESTPPVPSESACQSVIDANTTSFESVTSNCKRVRGLFPHLRKSNNRQQTYFRTSIYNLQTVTIVSYLIAIINFY